MTVSDDPMDRFGLSSRVALCVSPLTEGAESELGRQETVENALISGTDAR